MAKSRRGEITVDGFAGLNELLSPYDLGDAEENWLVEAENVDIDDGGSIRRRPGATRLETYTDPHSLWSDGENTLFCEQGNLRRVDNVTGSSLSTTAVLTGVGDTKFGYAKLHDRVYFSNTKKRGMLLENGDFHGWEVETPSGQPTLSTITGTLNIDHSISVFVTYIDDLGREGAAGGIATLNVTAETGVQLTNIPVPSSSAIENKVIYCTPPDGDVFYMVDVIDTNVTTYNITNFNHKTVQQTTLFLSEPPLGSIVAAESGRILVASGKYVYLSQPLMYHLFNRRQGYFEFAEEVSIIAPVDGGVFIAADKTYFISLRDENAGPDEVLPYGAVKGSYTEIPAEKLREGEQGSAAGWLSENGWVVGSPGGRVSNLTEAKTAIGSAVEGASLVRDDGGYTRVVSTHKPGGESSGLRATDYVAATITKSPAQSTLNTADNYHFTADTTTITADET